MLGRWRMQWRRDGGDWSCCTIKCHWFNSSGALRMCGVPDDIGVRVDVREYRVDVGNRVDVREDRVDIGEDQIDVEDDRSDAGEAWQKPCVIGVEVFEVEGQA